MGKKQKIVLPPEISEDEIEVSDEDLQFVNTDFKAASFTQDVMERRRIQSETLSDVFQTFFRILKQSMQSIAIRVLQGCGLVGYRKVLAAGCTMGKWPLAQVDAKAHVNRTEGISSSSAGASGGHPLLAPCLNGIGKFAHLIDLDFMGDLINYLRKLAGGGNNSDGSSYKFSKQLTVAERLCCCIVAFKVMRNNLDALNIDLQDFFVQLYSIIQEYRPGSRDQGEILAEALKIMLCDDRQHDMQCSAAFIKCLATFSLCFGSAESMAAMVTVKQLLQKNVKCQNLLENDAGGGSVSGPIAKYQPYASDPILSGALASVLWDLM
ncbi:binding protein [Actinidia rufa]|uniref:Binding protein n=1 Tax=Actinidia rufa TaxID=165716 RepID=A0A7J0GPB3_9ERIC|nr:binding protein [Actinidia rufa]